jgi:SRSO17 transposase
MTQKRLFDDAQRDIDHQERLMGMDQEAEESEKRFAAYVEQLASAIGHAERKRPLKDYCTGLVMPLERKSVEPLAALTEPGHASAQHQSLLHFVGESSWSDEDVLAKVCGLVLPSMERQEAIAAWIIDDTAIPKKGKHSVGVAHQYCGQLGKQANCQAAVSLSIANHQSSLPIAWRLYLPQEWTKDRARCTKAGVPRNIRFKTKPQIALDQIRAACRGGLPQAPALMDAGFGKDTGLRTSLTELGVSYVAGILPQTKVWAEGRRKPHSVEKLALSLPAEAWREVQWREGAGKRLSSRFARIRVRAAHRKALPVEDPRAEEWLLVEWPKREKKPIKYMLSTLPEGTAFSRMVDIAKLRWRIERDYEELKQEVGLGHFEGRGWRGFHHHATLCIATYGFLVSERETIPPSASYSSARSQTASLSRGHRSEDASFAASTPYAEFNRDTPLPPDLGACEKSTTMSMLSCSDRKISPLQTRTKIMTQ